MYNEKAVKLFSKNLIDIVLKTSQIIKKYKKYDLVFKMAILSLKNIFLFIIFFNSHLIVSTNKVSLNKILDSI